MAIDEIQAKLIEVNDGNFEQSVLQSKVPVLVDFWAPWCGPCMMAAPLLETLAEKYSGRLIIARLNVSNNAKTAARYGIMSIPNLIIFKNGQPFSQIIGYNHILQLLRN